MNLLTRSVETMLLKFINVDRYLPLQIDITNSCNLRCVHCYHPHHNNAGAIGFAEWKLILTEYKKLIEILKIVVDGRLRSGDLLLC